MSEMSDMFKLEVQLELAKKARVGTNLTYFDVIELLGEINSLYEYIDVLEGEIKAGHFYQELDFIEPDDDDEEGYIYFSVFDDGLLVATHWMPLPQPPNDTQTETFVYGKEREE